MGLVCLFFSHTFCFCSSKHAHLTNQKSPHTADHTALAAAAAPPTAPLPSILVCTADHDDRVVPLHSYKVVAALQAAWGGAAVQSRPILLRVESKAGHGAGKPTSKILDEYSEVYGFIATETGAKWASS